MAAFSMGFKTIFNQNPGSRFENKTCEHTDIFSTLFKERVKVQ